MAIATRLLRENEAGEDLALLAERGRDLGGHNAASLLELLRVVAPGEAGGLAVEDFALVAEAAELGPWLNRIPPAMIEPLAAITAADLADLSRSWRSRLENRRDSLAELERVLESVGEACREAQCHDTGLLLWMAWT